MMEVIPLYAIIKGSDETKGKISLYLQGRLRISSTNPRMIINAIDSNPEL
jgi:hypothetical protein